MQINPKKPSNNNKNYDRVIVLVIKLVWMRSRNQHIKLKRIQVHLNLGNYKIEIGSFVPLNHVFPNIINQKLRSDLTI